MSHAHLYRHFFLRAFVIGAFLFSGIFFYTSPISAQEKVKDDLNDAIKDGEKDILFSGKEGDDVTIKKNVTVTGESRSKAVINGDVTLENGAVLKNVTINAQTFGVTVEKNATVTLENVSIKGALDTGIWSKEGTGTLTVRNSSITKNRKGFYIQPGKNVVITGNAIAENSEEGIDIRDDVDGVISGNTISGNGEGGVEIIVGNSTLTITRNIFADNKSSGLSLQFYPKNDLGKMTVSLNTMARNGEFGLRCSSPSGGDKPSNFFLDSVKLLENTFTANKKAAVRGCGDLINVVPGEEKPEEEEIVEEPEPAKPALPFEEEPSRIKEVRLEKIVGEIQSVETQIKRERSWMERLRHYVFQTDSWYFATQEENLHRLQEELLAAQALPESDGYPEIKEHFPEKIDFVENKLGELSALLEAQASWRPFGR